MNSQLTTCTSHYMLQANCNQQNLCLISLLCGYMDVVEWTKDKEVTQYSDYDRHNLTWSRPAKQYEGEIQYRYMGCLQTTKRS